VAASGDVVVAAMGTLPSVSLFGRAFTQNNVLLLKVCWIDA
jgi:hypothetical protein